MSKIKQVTVYSFDNTGLRIKEIPQPNETTVSNITTPILSAIENITKPYRDFAKWIVELTNRIEQTTDALNALTAQYETIQTPTLYNSLQTTIKKIEDSKKEIQGNLWYELTETELQITTSHNEKQAKELREKDKLIQALKNNLENANRRADEAVEISLYSIRTTQQPTPPKPQSVQPQPKPLTLKPNFTDAEFQIKTLHDNSKFMFIATLEQWQNLFSDNIQPFPVPIELRQGVTLAMLREFINELIFNKVIGKRGTFITLVKMQVFSFDNSIVDADQFKGTTKTLNNPYYTKSDKIQSIFSKMRL